jgi:hypothetical protein
MDTTCTIAAFSGRSEADRPRDVEARLRALERLHDDHVIDDAE